MPYGSQTSSECGGAGQACAACPASQMCNPATHTCSTICTPSCAGKCAGASDGCNGTCTTNDCAGCCTASKACVPYGSQTSSECGGANQACAACPSGQTCNPSTHACCSPSCAGKCAGAPDGCGGVCQASNCAGCCSGSTCVPFASETSSQCGGANQACTACPSGQTCDVTTHTCKPICTPTCTAKCAGESNGCGGTCPTDQCTGSLGEVTSCAASVCMQCKDHMWDMPVTPGGIGYHDDLPGQCNVTPSCSASVSGADLVITCNGYQAGTARTWGSDVMKLMALSYGLYAPKDVARCLSAWGVWPLKQLTDSAVTFRIPGGASNTSVYNDNGLTTTLSAAAYSQHPTAAAPKLPSVPLPTTKGADRALDVFWVEPSASGIAGTVPPPYSGFNGTTQFSTYSALVDHVFRNEVYSPTATGPDTILVLPIWLPHYDSAQGTTHHVVVHETVCQAVTSGITRSLNVLPVPYSWPSTYPANY